MKDDKRTNLKAIALTYQGQGAPIVSAKGKGEVAKKIIEIAKENDVHLYQDDTITELLSKVSLNDEIPENLYLAVAKVLSFIYNLERCEK